MYINKYDTDSIFQVVMVCVAYSPTILSLIIFNFPLVFKISQQFVEICLQVLIMKFFHKFQQNE